MLLALYWKEILGSGKVQVVRFVSRLKVPFIAICIIAPAVEIASAVLRAITVGGFGFMALIAGIMYIVIIIGTFQRGQINKKLIEILTFSLFLF